MPQSVMNPADKRQLPDFQALLKSPLRLPAYEKFPNRDSGSAIAR